MFEKIGMAITAFGIMCADSRNLLIPVAIVAVGMLMVMIGERRCNDETDNQYTEKLQAGKE